MKKKLIAKKKENKSAKRNIWLLAVGLILLIFSRLYSSGIYNGMKNEIYFILLLISAGVFYAGLFLVVDKPYINSWRYLKESKNYFYFVVFLFIFSAILGFIFSEKLGFLDEILKELIKKTQDLGTLELFDFILLNNIQVSFLGLFLGLLFGIFSFFNAFANGLVLGYVFHGVWTASGLREFWRILPHGIFELPAIFISLGLGIKLGMFAFSKGRENLVKRAYNSLLVFLFVIVPLLIVASVIESLLINLL